MRHFLSLQPVPQLALRVHPSPPTAPLVALPRDPLPTPPSSSRALPLAVPNARHVAHRAQRERTTAARVPTDDDVQRDHGPRRREARHPRGPVRPKTGRTATSRSRGAIEGTEGPAFVSSLYASPPRVPRWGLAAVRALRPVVTFTAIVGSRPRGHRCPSPRSVVTTYAAININGLRNRDLQRLLYATPPSDAKDQRRRSARISYLLRVLRAHGVLHKIPKSHRYKVSSNGRDLLTAVLAAHRAPVASICKLAA
jgi:hypothetical protein